MVKGSWVELLERVLVMASKLSHCLNDLIFRWRAGTLGHEIAVVVSNHEDLSPLAQAAGLPFVHVPITPATKSLAVARLRQPMNEHNIDLVVLARYLQIPSGDLWDALAGRTINIPTPSCRTSKARSRITRPIRAGEADRRGRPSGTANIRAHP